MPEKFPMPSSSWEKIKKIVQAYGAVQDEENPTVESVAQLAGMHRPDVSKNNNFLREVGLLLPDEFKLTQPGFQLAMGLSLGNQDLVTEALQQVVLETPFFSRLVNILKARGTMRPESFRGQLIMETGLSANSPALNSIKALMDIMEESKLISISEDGVSLKLSNRITLQSEEEQGHEEERKRQKERERRGEGFTDTEKDRIRMPIPLGPNRIAFVELPNDWNSKDRVKLIKLLELSLATDEES